MNNPKKDLHPLDVRNRTKEEAMMTLFRAETTYLSSRGWIVLCGTPDNKYYVARGEEHNLKSATLYTHDEALSIQKNKDL